MKRSLQSLLLACIACPAARFAHDGSRADDDGYAIQSLNTPDPIFTARRYHRRSG